MNKLIVRRFCYDGATGARVDVYCRRNVVSFLLVFNYSLCYFPIVLLYTHATIHLIKTINLYQKNEQQNSPFCYLLASYQPVRAVSYSKRPAG